MIWRACFVARMVFAYLVDEIDRRIWERTDQHRMRQGWSVVPRGFLGLSREYTHPRAAAAIVRCRAREAELSLGEYGGRRW